MRCAMLGVISRKWEKTCGRRNCGECTGTAGHWGGHQMHHADGIVRGWETNGEGDEGPQKNVEVMYLDANAGPQHLEHFATPPAPNDTWITWSTRYLVEKEIEA